VKQEVLRGTDKILDILKSEFDNYPGYWHQMIVNPLAEEIAKVGSFDSYDVAGPFGICARVQISFYNSEKENVASISLVPELSDDEERSILSKVDYTTISDEFAPNTIGAINGMNFGLIGIDNKGTASDLLKLLDFPVKNNV
jgi:hypothetical protein